MSDPTPPNDDISLSELIPEGGLLISDPDLLVMSTINIDPDQLNGGFPIQYSDAKSSWHLRPDGFHPPIPRYCLASDGSHGYFIPYDMQAEWEAWLESDPDEAPDWATRIDGGQLTFFFPEII